jgi:histidyl-tRNA synthetase
VTRSFGIDRILSVLKKRLESSPMQVRATEVDVYVMAFGSGLLPERMSLCRELWDAGIKAEFAYKLKPRFDKQFKDAEKAGIPFAIILGEDELARGEIKVSFYLLNPCPFIRVMLTWNNSSSRWVSPKVTPRRTA